MKITVEQLKSWQAQRNKVRPEVQIGHGRRTQRLANASRDFRVVSLFTAGPTALPVSRVLVWAKAAGVTEFHFDGHTLRAECGGSRGAFLVHDRQVPAPYPRSPESVRKMTRHNSGGDNPVPIEAFEPLPAS